MQLLQNSSPTALLTSDSCRLLAPKEKIEENAATVETVETVEIVAIDVIETAGDPDHRITVPERRVATMSKIRTRLAVTTALGKERIDIVAVMIGESGIGIEAREDVRLSATMTKDHPDESANYLMTNHAGSVVEKRSEEARVQRSARRSLRLI